MVTCSCQKGGGENVTDTLIKEGAVPVMGGEKKRSSFKDSSRGRRG